MGHFWGLDGCKAGWLAVSIADDETLTYDVYDTITAFWQAVHETVDRVLVDIPVGLPSDEPRPVDSLARQHLPGRSSTVFPVPCRQAVVYGAEHDFERSAYETACDINERVLGQRFPLQSWYILPKVAEVDELLQKDDHARDSIYETHPEILFAALNDDAPVPYRKKSGMGFYERVTLLQEHLPAIYPHIRTIYDTHKSALVEDDILDAIVVALAARTGALHSLPDPPDRDATGLPMQIVIPAAFP